MTSKIDSDEDFKTSTKRITATLDLIDFIVVDKLIGVKGNSKSKVIAHIVKEWIEDNSDKVKNDYGIDLIEIRRKLLAEERGLPDKKELKKLDEEVLNRVIEFFEMADDADLEELADYINIDKKSVRDLIFGYRNVLEENGLKLKFSQGRFKKI